MRNSTWMILGLAAMAAMPATAGKASPLGMMKDAKVRVFDKESRVKSQGSRVKSEGSRVKSEGSGMMRMSELAQRMKPGVIKTFGWDGADWMPEDTYTDTYDKAGNVTLENAENAEGTYSRTVYGYDSNNMMISKETWISDDGNTYENSTKSSKKYDPILTKVIIDSEEWMWYGREWSQRGNNYKRIITRDESGNITSAVIAVLFQGIYDPTMKVLVTYGEDGRATEISEEILNYDYYNDEYYWEQGTKITDIVWDRTDGQIYSLEDLFIGNNRIGSALYHDPDGLDMNVTVEYADDSDAYTVTSEMTMDGESVASILEYTPLENSGYIAQGTTYYMDEEIYSYREEYRYDDWGLLTLGDESETEEGYTYGEKTVGDVEYDAEGKPDTYTISVIYQEMDDETSEYMLRAEYSDYVDVTASSSVNGIEAAEAEKSYDLNGMPVSSAEKGRIVIKGGKAVMQ